MLWIVMVSFLYGAATGFVLLRLPAFVVGIAIVLFGFGILLAFIERGISSAWLSVVVVLICCQFGYVTGVVLRSTAARLLGRPEHTRRLGTDTKKRSKR